MNDNDSTTPLRIRRIRLHPDVYAAYARLYDDAMTMTGKMDDVLDHPEHERLMEIGVQRGMNMPDVEAVRARNRIIKRYLKGIDVCRDVVHGAGYVEFPACTARDLQMVAFYSQRMIADVWENVLRSDYMPCIRYLKQGGAAYLGPTSLQEVVNLWASLILSNNSQTKHHPPQQSRLPRNWMEYVV